MTEDQSTTPERYRDERGHAFYPPASMVRKIPPLYATDGTPLAERVIWLHYFAGACDWWLVEYDPAEKIGFGYACLGDPMCAEWGYVPLDELEIIYEPIRFEPFPDGLWGLRPPVIVERDLYWQPVPVREAALPGRPI